MSIDLKQSATCEPTLLLRYRDRQYAAEMLAVAINKLNLFTWIDAQGSVSTEAIAREFGLASRPLDVLLTLCRASGLITTRKQTHQLTLLAKESLVESAPWFLGPYYAPVAESPIAQSCLHALTKGCPANWQASEDGSDWHESMMDQEFAQAFTDVMNCRGIALGQALADALMPMIRSVDHVLDVGGGSGIYSAVLAAKNPHLRATVLEQAPVDTIAKSEIQRHALEDRIDVVSGNMFEVAWPDAIDCILLSNVLHDWDLPEVQQLIEASANTLASGGLLVIHEAFLNDDKTGPLPVAEYSVLLATITQGKCYSPAEYGTVLAEHGFDVGGYQDTIADRGFITAIKR